MRTRDRPASGPRSPAVVCLGGAAFAGQWSCLSDRGELRGRWPSLMRSPPRSGLAHAGWWREPCPAAGRHRFWPDPPAALVEVTGYEDTPGKRGGHWRRGGRAICRSVAGATGRPRRRPRSHTQSRGVLRHDHRGWLPLQRGSAVSDASPVDGRDLRTSEYRFLRPGAPARALTAADRTHGRNANRNRIRHESQLPARSAGHTPSGGRAAALAPALAPGTSGSDQRRLAVGWCHPARRPSDGGASPAAVRSQPRGRAELCVWRARFPLGDGGASPLRRRTSAPLQGPVDHRPGERPGGRAVSARVRNGPSAGDAGGVRGTKWRNPPPGRTGQAAARPRRAGRFG